MHLSVVIDLLYTMITNVTLLLVNMYLKLLKTVDAPFTVSSLTIIVIVFVCQYANKDY